MKRRVFQIIFLIFVTFISIGASPPRYGGSLNIGVYNMPEPPSDNPPSMESYEIYSLVYEPFMTNNKMIGVDIVETPDVPPTVGVHYTFELRVYPESRFHDGRPPTSADIKYSLERAGKLDPWVGMFLKSAQLIIIDHERLEISPPPPLEVLSSKALILLSVLDSERSGFPPGTGPFTITKQTANRIELSAYNQHAEGRPYLDQVTMILLPPGLTPASALESKYVDAVLGEVKDLPSYSVIPQDVPMLIYLAIGEGAPLLQNQAIRQGISNTLDRKSMRAFVTGRVYEALDFMRLLYINNYSEEIPEVMAYDPEGAKKKIELASEGAALPELFLWYPEGDRELKQVSERVQVDLMNAGFHISLRSASRQEMEQKLRDRKFDLIIDRYYCYSNLLRNPDAIMLSFLDQPERERLYGLLSKYMEEREKDVIQLEARLLEQARFLPLYHEISCLTVPVNLFNVSDRDPTFILNEFLSRPKQIHLYDAWYIEGTLP